MALIIKQLFLATIIASLVFMLAKPIALTFTPVDDFNRRRKAWFALTILAYLSPSFWLFVLLAIPILVVTGRKDSNPVAVYLMLLSAVPPIGKKIPMVGISYLFYLNTYLLLSICILMPVAIRMLRDRSRPRHRGIFWIDFALLGYGLLNAFHYLQAQSITGEIFPITITDSIRRMIVFALITCIPYFVTSRSNADRRFLVDSIATYCLACGLLAGIAVYESLRGWLIYGDIPARLGDELGGTEYLIRDQSLRAMASTGHPLSLATLLSIAIPLWLYLRTRVESKRARLGFSILLGSGLLVTYSRGPWIGAVSACLVFVALQPRGLSSVLKTTATVLLIGAILSLTPFGQKVIGLLPMFGGHTDVGTLTYREALFDRSLTVIAHHPLIGDSASILEMQDLRQGEGIIDLVNVYIQVLLNDGFVGLALLLGFLLLGASKANAGRRQLARADPDMAMLISSLLACMVGLFVTLAGGSFGNGTERMYYILGGFMVAAVILVNSGKSPKLTGAIRVARAPR